MRPTRLITRSRIGVEMVDSIETKTVECSRLCRRRPREITTWLRIERVKFTTRVRRGRDLDRNIDPIRLRRPEPKKCLAPRNQFCTNRQTPSGQDVRHVLISTIGRGAVAAESESLAAASFAKLRPFGEIA